MNIVSISLSLYFSHLFFDYENEITIDEKYIEQLQLQIMDKNNEENIMEV